MSQRPQGLQEFLTGFEVFINFKLIVQDTGIKKWLLGTRTLQGNTLVLFSIEHLGENWSLFQWFKQSVFSQQFPDKRQTFSNSSSHCRERTADLGCIYLSLLSVSAKKSYVIWYTLLIPLDKKAFDLGCILFRTKSWQNLVKDFRFPR